MTTYNPYVVTRHLKIAVVKDTKSLYRGTKHARRQKAVAEERHVGCDFVNEKLGIDYPNTPITGYLAGPNPGWGIEARDVLVDMLTRGKYTHLVIDWGGSKTEWAVKDIPHQDVHAPCEHPGHWLLRFNKL